MINACKNKVVRYAPGVNMEIKFFYKIFKAGFHHACIGGKKEENPYPDNECERSRMLHTAWNCGFKA